MTNFQWRDHSKMMACWSGVSMLVSTLLACTPSPNSTLSHPLREGETTSASRDTTQTAGTTETTTRSGTQSNTQDPRSGAENQCTGSDSNGPTLPRTPYTASGPASDSHRPTLTTTSWPGYVLRSKRWTGGAPLSENLQQFRQALAQGALAIDAQIPTDPTRRRAAKQRLYESLLQTYNLK